MCSTMVSGCAGGSGGAWGQQAPDCPACTLGFNPRWGQTLQFQLRAPELVLVRFVVEDYDTTSPNDFVGQFTLPLNSLKQGGWGWKGRGSGPPRPCSPGPWMSSESLPRAPRWEVVCAPTALALKGWELGWAENWTRGSPPHRVPPHPPAFQGRRLTVTSHALRPHPHPALLRVGRPTLGLLGCQPASCGRGSVLLRSGGCRED